MNKISDKVINFITEDMKNRKKEFTARGKTLAEVKIQRYIFQGVTLLPSICNCNDATQSHNYKIHWVLQIYQIARKDKTTQCIWTTSEEKELLALIQTISKHNQNLRVEFRIENMPY